jgi:hypothetical protein
LRRQGGAKLAEFRSTRKKKKISLLQKSSACPDAEHNAIHARHSKVRKTPWGSFAHLRVFPIEMAPSNERGESEKRRKQPQPTPFTPQGHPLK